MIKWQALAVAGAAAAVLGASEARSDQIRGVENVGDWTVYETELEPRECGVITRPKKTVNRRDGKVVEVRRSEIYLAAIVTSNAQGLYAVSFQGGYPFREGSRVTVNIDGRDYMFDIGNGETEGFAWPAVEDNAAVVEAMRSGNTVVVYGTSSRGTLTQDQFSLLGVTKAMGRAAELCSTNRAS